MVEDKFALLKSMWRILITLMNIERAVKILRACTILHNFCYINNDLWNKHILLGEEDVYENADVNIQAQHK